MFYLEGIFAIAAVVLGIVAVTLQIYCNKKNKK
jgi:hypothetical protein